MKKSYKNLITLFLVFLSVFNINNCYAAKVGDSYDGGTVFCVSDTPDVTKCKSEGSGSCGLIMANKDQVNYDSNFQHGITWSSVYSEVLGARSEDKGKDNTDAIIKAFSKDDLNNNAALACRNYKDPIEGNIDWYLPAKNELSKMYLFAKANNLIGKNCAGEGKVNDKVRCLIGGFDDGHKLYWSSTQAINDNSTWAQYFGSAGQNGAYKLDDYLGVRAIRVFNSLSLPKIEEIEIKEMKDKRPKIRPRPVSIDELYGGGIVFCVSQTPDTTKCKTEGSGYYGLVVTTELLFDPNNDNKGIRWSTAAMRYHGVPEATSKNDGSANTKAIITTLYIDKRNAAWRCHDYRGGGYDDWYLPAINELEKLAEHYNIDNYWSSTECGYNTAWGGFNHGGVEMKFKPCKVRAIRAFDVFKDLKNKGFEYEPEEEIGPKTFAPLKGTKKAIENKATELTTFLPKEQIEKELESKLRMEIEAKLKEVFAIEIKQLKDENELKLKREADYIKEIEQLKKIIEANLVANTQVTHKNEAFLVRGNKEPEKENKLAKIMGSIPEKKPTLSEKKSKDEKKTATKVEPRQSKTGEMWKKTKFDSPFEKGKITPISGGHKHTLSTSFTTPKQSILNKSTSKYKGGTYSTIKSPESKKDK